MGNDSNPTYKDSSVEELGIRLANGDRAAFEALFRILHTPLVRFSHGITGDEDAAYDILQDVFLKLWEKRGEQAVHTSLKAMMYTMVKNRSLNWIRDRQRRLEKDRSRAHAEVHQAESPESEVDVVELQARIQHWIGELPVRQAFRLSRYAGLTHTEISRIMDVSERTVGTHILLALKNLRQRLDRYREEVGSA